MKVLVTGGLGFIGQHACEHLRLRGHEVAVADKKSGYDLAEAVRAEAAFSDTVPDRVVHLASTCSTPGSVLDPLGTFRDTVQTAANVLEACHRRGIPVVMVSSVKARDGMTPYGKAKQMVEMWAHEYQEAYGLPVPVVRPGTVYGPGQEGSPESGWIAWFLKAKRENLPVTINGTGEQVRDLLHVSDMADLLVKMVEDPEGFSAGEGEWDVGGGAENIVSIKWMADFLGLDYTFGSPRYGDADAYVGKNDVPGWEPLINWRNALPELY